MKKKISNKSLQQARKAKKDEFYTQLTDIEKELRHYKRHFKNKIIFCNCDDPYESNFFKFFANNFNNLGLKKLITTCYSGSPIVGGQLPLFFIKGLKSKGKKSFKLEINKVRDYNKDGAISLSDVEWLLRNKKNTATPLKQGGDFRSNECIKILKEADVIVTNPPFSLFREYVAQLMEYKKKFVIIGNVNAISYKEIFKHIKRNKIWLGHSIHSGDREFRVPNNYPLKAVGYRIDNNGNKYIRIKGVRWFTNLDYKKRYEDLILCKKYSKKAYPKYDNYDAINVDKTQDIPMDYKGVMGVPVTFMDKYNPEQFEILGSNRGIDQDPNHIYGKSSMLKGKETFKRLFIKNKYLNRGERR